MFEKLKASRQKKDYDRNLKCASIINEADSAIKEANSFTENKEEYASVALATRWMNKYGYLFDERIDRIIKKLKKSNRVSELQNRAITIKKVSESLMDSIKYHNKRVEEKKLTEAYSLIGDVEGRHLDRQQMLCIIKEAHNHLIIAGAGTGKTTTIVGKIKYLIKSNKCKPSDILVLSFTNASAAEMSDRITKEIGCSISASTFHKLGLDIITQVEGIKPRISQLSLRNLIRKNLPQLMRDSNYVKKLSNYIINNRVHYRPESDFKTAKEYNDYLHTNPPITIRKETVKSYGELDIANFLFQNRIKYVYERSYPIDTRTSEYGQYYPDFYLPDYDIYIEYFGIDKNGNVPDWFSKKGGKSASQVYREGMKWKRKLHKNYNTTLIECYAYEKSDETLLDNLSKHLKENKVVFSPLSPQEIWETVSRGQDSIIDGVIELFETVINLAKSNGFSIDDLKAFVKETANAKRHFETISLIEPHFTAYNQQLEQAGEIDFNDMINLAAEYIRDGKFKNPFSYVVIDEYQDISKARFSLLEALRLSREYDLFCVGDDWQSIYRFAGSDISYILEFEKYWGQATISKIETTYRFTNSLIDISGNFIMQNPAQKKKQLQGVSTDYRFSLGEIRGYNEEYAIRFMSEKIEDLPKNSTVFFIGRYSFDINILKDNEQYECQYNNSNGIVDVKYSNRPDLKMSFITAHKSKGLQADYIFIINNKNSRMGFPSKIQDDSIVDCLLNCKETFPYAEERRLYYVALTRAKVKAFFITVKGNESVFVTELKNRYKDQLKRERFECPICGGRLVKISSQNGVFLGCQNYREDGCTYKRKIRNKTTLS